MTTFPCSMPGGVLHVNFLALLPRIETHARIYFRDVRCPDQKAERVAEAVALAWKWYRRLVELGKDVADFPAAFATLVARAVRSGRRVCGQEKARDVLSSRAQRFHGFKVEALPASTAAPRERLYGEAGGQRHLDAYEERLRDNTVTPPPDAAAFRVDFPQFLGGLEERDRRMAEFLSLGHNAKTAAGKFRLSPGRVTQLRQRWCREWRDSQGEDQRQDGGWGRRRQGAAKNASDS